jgi:hypothetical protein
MTTNAERLQNALDYLVQEYEQHCLDRMNGKERVTYTLNGRNVDWNTYNRDVQQQIMDAAKLLSSFSIPHASVRIG